MIRLSLKRLRVLLALSSFFSLIILSHHHHQILKVSRSSSTGIVAESFSSSSSSKVKQQKQVLYSRGLKRKLKHTLSNKGTTYATITSALKNNGVVTDEEKEVVPGWTRASRDNNADTAAHHQSTSRHTDYAASVVSSIPTTTTKGYSNRNDRRQRRRKRKRRPKFILHVGLPKTATTFLQCALCSQANVTEPVLLKDNWVYLGTCPSKDCRLAAVPAQFQGHRLNFFFQNKNVSGDVSRDEGILKYGPVPHTSTGMMNETSLVLSRPRPIKLSVDFMRRVRRLHQEGRNVMIIFEALHNLEYGQIQALADFLQPKDTTTNGDYWDVQVLIAYRPLYAWLPSKYNSVTKKFGYQKQLYNTPVDEKVGPGKSVWPGEINQNGFVGTHVLPFDLDNRGDFTDLVHSIESTQQHPTETSMRNFALHFANVSVIPLHNLPPVETEGVDPVLNHLFCVLLKDSAPSICNAVHSKVFGSSKRFSNPSISFNYDMLGTAAYEAGIVDKAARRVYLRERIRFQQEKILNRSADDFPLSCLPSATLNRLENLSWLVERRLFLPDSSSAASKESAQRAHQNSFAKAVAKKTYCWIDTNRTLQNPTWRSFLSTPRT